VKEMNFEFKVKARCHSNSQIGRLVSPDIFYILDIDLRSIKLQVASVNERFSLSRNFLDQIINEICRVSQSFDISR